MMLRTKHLFLMTGYHATSDCRWGITVGLLHRVVDWGCKYRFMFSFSFDLPRLTWWLEDWRINEPDCVKGLPIRRQGIPSSAWTGRDKRVVGIRWPHMLSWGAYR